MKRRPSFGIVAPELGWVPAPSYLLRRQRILDLLGPLAPGRLLEVGCGAGALLADLDSMGFSCDALETSPEAREIAETIHEASDRVTIHARPTPDWLGAFDVVAAFEVLEHIEDHLAALREWKEWLAPRGRLLVSVPARRSLWNASDVWAGHFRRYERGELERALVETGYSVERLECYGFPLANCIHPVRGLVHRRILSKERTKPANTGADQSRRSHRSGIQRSAERSLYPLQESLPGRLMLRLALRLQALTLGRNLGTGYLAVARLREDG